MFSENNASYIWWFFSTNDDDVIFPFNLISDDGIQLISESGEDLIVE